MTRTKAISDDLMDPAFIRDPYPYLAALREAAPVYWNERWGGWLLTGYEAIAQIHGNPALSNDKYSGFSALKAPGADQQAVFDCLGLWMGSQDAPLHTRLRKSVQTAFASRASLEAVEPVIRATARALLEDLQNRPGFDLIDDFAYPLTRAVIAGMLGMPREDLDRIAPWSDAVAPIMFMNLSGDKAARYRRARHELEDMADYYRAALRARRERPRDDLMTSIAESVAAGELTEEEAIATCMTVVFGGHETTKDLLGNGVLLLLQHQGALGRLRAEPALWAGAVEEMLRYESPAKSTVRWARAEFEIAGQVITEGQRLLVFWAGANRDPAQFPDPDRFDIARNPNPHLSFGHGPHYCLGAALGRREAVIALPMLFDAIPDLALAVAPEALQWHPTIIMRSLRRLPLTRAGAAP